MNWIPILIIFSIKTGASCKSFTALQLKLTHRAVSHQTILLPINLVQKNLCRLILSPTFQFKFSIHDAFLLYKQTIEEKIYFGGLWLLE